MKAASKSKHFRSGDIVKWLTGDKDYFVIVAPTGGVGTKQEHASFHLLWYRSPVHGLVLIKHTLYTQSDLERLSTKVGRMPDIEKMMRKLTTGEGKADESGDS